MSGVSGLVIGVSSLVLPAPAIAEAQVIEEVVVTARKRTENQQDVPAAISAFGASELEDRGIESIEELARLTPNITINETSGLIAGAVQVFVRGIGNDPGFDQGVGIYVDDVYLNRTTGALLEVYDIERIEVLKGPQGHLYGRNTIGGAIKYVSADPGNESRFFVEGKVGTDNLRRYKAGISGALIEDKLLGSLAVSKTDMDGYQTNVFNGDKYADQDKLAYRGSLIWNVSDSFRVKLAGDQFKDRSNPYVPTRVAVNRAGPAGLDAFSALLSTANMFCPPAQCAYLAPGETLDTQLFSDEDTVNTGFVGPGGFDEFRITTRNYAMTLDWDLSESWAVKSVTAQRKIRNNTPFDFDGSSQVFINTLQRSKLKISRRSCRLTTRATVLMRFSVSTIWTVTMPTGYRPYRPRSCACLQVMSRKPLLMTVRLSRLPGMPTWTGISTMPGNCLWGGVTPRMSRK